MQIHLHLTGDVAPLPLRLLAGLVALSLRFVTGVVGVRVVCVACIVCAALLAPTAAIGVSLLVCLRI